MSYYSGLYIFVYEGGLKVNMLAKKELCHSSETWHV